MFRAQAIADAGPVPYDCIVLTHEERHLRRRLLTTVHDEPVMVDLPHAVRLVQGQRLVLDDGRHLEIIAAEEPLYEVTARDGATLARLAWHLGNRHARIEIAGSAIYLARDHVLGDMLAGLGATVTEVSLPFHPHPPHLAGVPHHHHD